MMIGPAPMMRMVEISVRLGIGFLGSFARRAWAQENAPSRSNRPEGAQLSGNERGIGLPRSLAEIGVARKGAVERANSSGSPRGWASEKSLGDLPDRRPERVPSRVIYKRSMDK